MLTLLKNYSGKIEINGIEYKNIHDAIKRFKSDTDTINIKLHSNVSKANTTQNSTINSIRKITVKQYMTREASPEFDFMSSFNNNIPMPLRTMVGTVERETAKMVFMDLHADITEERTMRCLKCGRPITNPVSQYFGLGPECGGHNYVNPFYSEEELKAAVTKYRTEVLNKITWRGWLPKSSIIAEEVIDE